MLVSMASMSSAALGKLVLVQVPLSNETTTWKWVGLWSVLIGHMRVQKLSLSKWGQVYNLSCENDFYFAWEWKIIPLSKTEYLTSFWYIGPGDLEIAYCCTVNSKIPLELMQLWTSPYCSKGAIESDPQSVDPGFESRSGHLLDFNPRLLL